MFKWFTSKRRKLAPLEQPTQINGLNVKSALQSHSDWLLRLKAMIEGEQDASHIDVASAARDDLCALGKWIKTDGQLLYGKKPEFTELRLRHREFHLTVGDVCICFNRGDVELAKFRLRRDLRDRSDQVQLAIVRLLSPSN